MDVKHTVPKYKYKNPEIYALEKKKKLQNLFWIKKKANNNVASIKPFYCRLESPLWFLSSTFVSFSQAVAHITAFHNAH